MGPRHPIRLALLLLLAASLQAVDFGGLKPQGYVSDFAGVVDPAAKLEIEAYCARVKAATGVEMALVTLASLEGEPIEDVANVMFRKWGIGAKGKNEGILLLLSINDRRSRLEVGYGLEPIIPDGYAGSVIREMRPALRERNYGQALADAARSIGETVAKAKGVQIGVNAPMRRSRPPSSGFPIEVAYAVGALILLALLSRGGRGGRGGGTGNFLMGMMLGQLLGGGGRSNSGGGFGGSDSGDSFGGFGGGDSGGGGASSDW
ncbi:MAG TPA: TPM domain-containing protein [Paludibaculum sp.]|jgi:uncharacterized protein